MAVVRHSHPKERCVLTLLSPNTEVFPSRTGVADLGGSVRGENSTYMVARFLAFAVTGITQICDRRLVNGKSRLRSSMKSLASSSRKFAHATVRSWEAVKGALKAFILTLDSLPGSFTMERGNEAKRSSVELRSLVEGFCFLGSVSSVWRGTEWQP